MLKIDEENSIPVKTTVQQPRGKPPSVYLGKQLKDLGVTIPPAGQDLGLRVDRKAKVVYFKYGFGEQ